MKMTKFIQENADKNQENATGLDGSRLINRWVDLPSN
jgi:hypothetical protein